MNRQSRLDVAPARRSVDEVMALLANSQRRDALAYLVRESDEVVDLEVVADHVCSRHVVDHSAIRTALHHVHFPRLADAGVVAYDPACQHVRYLGSDLIERALETTDRLGLPGVAQRSTSP